MGEILEFTGRVSRTKRMESFTIFSVYGYGESFFSFEEFEVADEIKGAGIFCEKDGYEEVFLLYYGIGEPESEKIASAKGRLRGFPVAIEGRVAFLKQCVETTFLKLRDDSGYILVSLPKTEEMHEGSHIEVRGILAEEKVYVYERGVRIISTQYEKTKIADITREYCGEKVFVEGDVMDIYGGDSFVNLKIGDDTESIFAYFPEDVIRNFSM